MVVVETPKLKTEEKCCMIGREVTIPNPFNQPEEIKQELTFDFPREEHIEEERDSGERNGESIMHS